MRKDGRDRVNLLPGTLELMVLRTLTVMGPQHAYTIAGRIEQAAASPLQLNQGSLYPALVRLEQKGWIRGAWKITENNRQARYYNVTKAGTRALQREIERWERSTGLVNRLLTDEAT